MNPFGFDLPMRPPWHMGAYAQLDTRINRTNILFTAWGERRRQGPLAAPLSLIRNAQAKPQGGIRRFQLKGGATALAVP